MAFRDGVGTRQRVCAGETRKANEAFGKCGSTSSPTSSFPQHRFSVTDGRVARGIVELIDRLFVAIDVNGAIVGCFHTLRAAMRAFDDGGAP